MSSEECSSGTSQHQFILWTTLLSRLWWKMTLVKPNWDHALYRYLSLEPGIYKELVITWWTMFITVCVKHRFWFSYTPLYKILVWESTWKRKWENKDSITLSGLGSILKYETSGRLASCCIEHGFSECWWLYVTNIP